jgi:GntR family transcriptional regulator/MocR family aminotransferase
VPAVHAAAGRRIDLRPGGIRIDDGPGAIWESLLRSSWRELSGDLARARPERDRAGDPILRTAIAERVGATRGIDCGPDEVVITAGRRAGLATLAELLLAGNGTAVVEDPADLRAVAVLESAGATALPVPVDGRGIRTDLLPRSATLARVTPAWQESTGGTLPLDRRLELLAWAEHAGAVIVEDDPGGEFRLRGPGIPALRALESGGNVVYLDGIDDVLFDGVQLGYVIAPRVLASRLAERLDLLERRAGWLEQRALAKLLAEGHFDRHLRRLRQRLAERQAALVDAVRDLAPGVLRTAPAAAGRHLVVTVVEPTMSARTVAARAAGEGVLVQPLALHRRLGAADRDLLVGYSTEAPDRIHEGVRRLARVIDARVPGPGPTERPAAPSAQRRAARAVNAGPIVPRMAVALE